MRQGVEEVVQQHLLPLASEGVELVENKHDRLHAPEGGTGEAAPRTERVNEGSTQGTSLETLARCPHSTPVQSLQHGPQEDEILVVSGALGKGLFELPAGKRSGCQGVSIRASFMSNQDAMACRTTRGAAAADT